MKISVVHYNIFEYSLPIVIERWTYHRVGAVEHLQVIEILMGFNQSVLQEQVTLI